MPRVIVYECPADVVRTRQISDTTLFSGGLDLLALGERLMEYIRKVPQYEALLNAFPGLDG